MTGIRLTAKFWTGLMGETGAGRAEETYREKNHKNLYLIVDRVMLVERTESLASL